MHLFRQTANYYSSTLESNASLRLASFILKLQARTNALLYENSPRTAPRMSIFRKIYFCDSSVTIG